MNPSMGDPSKAKSRKIGFILLGIVLLLGVALFVYNATRSDRPQTTLITFTAESDKTVLEQTQARADVTLQDGVSEQFVQSINGVENGDNGMYWSYYVNGEAATQPEADFVTKGGELIEWKFEKLE